MKTTIIYHINDSTPWGKPEEVPFYPNIGEAIINPDYSHEGKNPKGYFIVTEIQFQKTENGYNRIAKAFTVSPSLSRFHNFITL